MKLIDKDAFTKEELVEFINYLLKVAYFAYTTQPFNFIYDKVDKMLRKTELELYEVKNKSLIENQIVWDKHKKIYKKIERIKKALSYED